MTKSEIVIYAINGIWNDSESIGAFTDRIELWSDKSDIDSHRYEPETPWTTRRMPWHLPKYVEATAELFKTCVRPHKILIAHSFGTEIALKALAKSRVYFDTVFLVQGACPADCMKNGINQLINDKIVRRFVITASTRDKVLPLARWWPPFANVWHPLGLWGPREIELHSRIHTHYWQFNHSEMWSEKHFDATMTWIANEAGIPL